MLHDLEILRLVQKHLVRVLPWLEHARTRGAGIHLRHLRGHLIGGWYR